MCESGKVRWEQKSNTAVHVSGCNRHWNNVFAPFPKERHKSSFGIDSNVLVLHPKQMKWTQW